MNSQTPDLQQAVRAQADWTAAWHLDPLQQPVHGWLGLVQQNHWHNFCLWHEEDLARRDDLGAEAVHRAKRAIDAHNQRRNDLVEQIDTHLLQHLPASPDAPLHSETPGMILDRLSILALKEYHMREQTERTDVGSGHLEKCARKLAVIREQRSDLAEVLVHLLDELRQGTRRCKVYFQFKMYNDPSLNPELYRK